MTGISVTDSENARREEWSDALHARSGVRSARRSCLESPHIFIGSVDGFVEKFQPHCGRSSGISSIMVGAVEELVSLVERPAGT